MTRPRYEIARVSELLQAQLLQDININPVQPSLSETKLGIITGGGPARPGFNEFTPLFERNQAQLNTTGVVGNQGTYGDEAVVSGIYDQFSVSAGQFHYRSDGFRKNFDVAQDIYDLFAQAAITPELNIQAEYSTRSTEEGDRRLLFEPSVYSKKLHRDAEQEMGRFGLRFAPRPNNNFIASLIYANRDDKLTQPRDPPNPFVQQRLNQDGYQAESGYILSLHDIGVIAGLGTYDVDTEDNLITSARHTNVSGSTTSHTAYLYNTLHFLTDLELTLGFSWDEYAQDRNKRTTFAPKLGVRWAITKDLSFRLAAFQAFKPAFIANRTIQPTQVAGFNQFYDDLSGTKSDTIGIGMDARFAEDLYGGVEYVRRDLDNASATVGHTDDRDEQLARVYLYWTPFDEIVMGGGVQLDDFDREKKGFGPTQVDTLSAPVTIRYFDASGFFTSAGVTFVHQDVNSPFDGDPRQQGSNHFVVLDAAVGFRFPERRGIISFQATNLLNEGFNYQDSSFQDQTLRENYRVSPYLPQRTFLGQITLNF